jgi:hypothetical protein
VIDVLVARVADVFDIVLTAGRPREHARRRPPRRYELRVVRRCLPHPHRRRHHVGHRGPERGAAALARDSEVFGIVTDNDGAGSTLDADLLDGMSSGSFQAASVPDEAQWFKETADSLGSTATFERVVFTAPANVTITDVVVEPAAAVTASDTAYATITVSRHDATGGGKGDGGVADHSDVGVGRHR